MPAANDNSDYEMQTSAGEVGNAQTVKFSGYTLITFTDAGLYCPAGGFYIDPWKPVDKAIITHAHSDHARPGNKYYLCHTLTKPLLQARLGNNNYEAVEWNEPLNINGVKVSLHPAGHIIGSSQVRIEYNNEVWVVSGDYKVEDDGISGAFEPVKCNVFITESTFGLPVYNWLPQQEIYDNICNWITHNKQHNQASLLIAYSLGKAQRLIKAIEPLHEKIWVHGAIYNMHQALIAAGVTQPGVDYITPATPKGDLKNAIIIAPPGAEGSPWIKRFLPYELGVCSGWMQVRGNVRRRNVDAGFALSDHADWKGLLQAVKATGAEKVYVTHGFQSAFSRYLAESGTWSAEVKTEYGSDEEETAAAVEINTQKGS
ncbi:MAG TPA: ligase-associated DNA damage response exonuclease [Chitinophagaceae bacterium]|nr:ligase-associated DNA damage response exonuclease [Chitinophagaceae bacterium]